MTTSNGEVPQHHDATSDSGPPTLPPAPAHAPTPPPPAAGTIPSTEAAAQPAAGVEHYREVARRSRRRNRRIAVTSLVVLLAVAGAGGVMVVRSYQEEQDRQTADRAERNDDRVDVEDDAIETARKLDAGEIVNGAMNPLDGPEPASEVPVAAPTPKVWAGYDNVQPDTGESDPASWVTIMIARWEDPAGPADTYVEHVYDHDTTHNDFVGYSRYVDSGESFVIGSDGNSIVSLSPTGAIVQRKFDKQPGQNHEWGLSRLITPDHVLPPEAAEFATDTGPLDPATGMEYGFVIDIDAWLQADEATFQNWAATWRSGGPARDWAPATMEDVLHKSQVDPSFSPVQLPSFDPGETASLVSDRSVIVAYAVDDDGWVERALVHSNRLDLRTYYEYRGRPEQRPVFAQTGIPLDSLDWSIESRPPPVVDVVVNPPTIPKLTLPPNG